MTRLGKNKNSGRWVMAVMIIVAVGLLGFGNLFSLGGNSSKSTRDIALSCTLDMYTQFHIHPHLRVIINGLKEVIPANVGIAIGCMHPIHTHDDTGTLHIESPEKRDFALADFFAVWDKPFSKDQIFNNRVDPEHEIVMTVDGKPNSQFENLVLEDNQQILIEYRPIRKKAN